MDVFDWIGQWVQSNCDSNWEHIYGIKIETLDNPGWFVKIDLQETALEGKSFETVTIHDNDSDWIVCRVNNGVFEGFGDLTKLKTILRNFQAWVNENNDTP